MNERWLIRIPLASLNSATHSISLWISFECVCTSYDKSHTQWSNDVSTSLFCGIILDAIIVVKYINSVVFFLFKCHRIYVVPFFNFRFILLQFDNFIIGFSKGFFFSCFHFSYSIFTDIKSTKSRHKYLALRIRCFFSGSR